MKTSLILRAAAVVALLVVAAGGCGRGRVGSGPQPVETLVEVGEPSYVVRALKRQGETNGRKETPSWVRRLQVVLEKEPGGPAALKKAYELYRGPAYRENTDLLKKLHELVSANRPAGASWDLLELRTGFKKPRRGRPRVTVGVGLRKVFGLRSEIVFEKIPLDVCIAKLARWGGIKDAQGRSYNPKVWWRKENINIKTAVDEVLAANGFDRRWSGVDIWRVLYPDEYSSREEFLKGAARVLLDAGRSLESDIPAVVVLPRVRKKRR